MKGHTTVLGALSALLLAAACGDAPDTADGTPESAADAPAEGTAPVPADQMGLPPDDADIRDVDATLTEWSVSLSQDSVPAGLIAFNVRNGGTVPHRFEVEGNGGEWESEDLPPGGDVTMSLNLSPGVYQVYCPIEAAGVNHAERGMTTTLRVY